MGSDFNPDGFKQLVMSMYALSCNDLLKAYRKVTTARSDANRQQAMEEAKKAEAWLLADPFCILSDPHRVIMGIQEKSKKKGNFHFEFTERGGQADDGQKIERAAVS